MTAYSATAQRFFEQRGISTAVAARAGVAERDGSLVFTVATAEGSFQRTRRLSGGPAKVLQPTGQPLAVWWPLGRPLHAPTVLLTEGESDALAALSALAQEPIGALPPHAVASLPGCGYPVDRLAGELRDMETSFAYFAFDADDPGRKLTRKASAALDLASIRSASLAIREGRDLADELARVPESLRGERFAWMLIDAHSAAEAAVAA